MTAATLGQICGFGPKHAREKDDFYATPPEAVHRLLAVETFESPIWEPACGKGHISEELKKVGYSVRSTDLVDRGYGIGGIDFLMEWRQEDRAASIITNPPFKFAMQFAQKGLQLADTVALLARLQFLESIERREFFQMSPLARVWVFSKRLTMVKDGEVGAKGGLLPFAWFVWRHGHEGRAQIGWI